MRCILLFCFFISQVGFANQNFRELEIKDDLSIGVETHSFNSKSELSCNYKDDLAVSIVFSMSATVWTVSAFLGSVYIFKNAFNHIENWKQQQKSLSGETHV